jgi:hypothetical protein
MNRVPVPGKGMTKQEHNYHDSKKYSSLSAIFILLCWTTTIHISLLDAFSVIPTRVSTATTTTTTNKFLIIGGTGKVGSAVANHILIRQPNATLILSGRNPNNAQCNVIKELQNTHIHATIQYLCYDFDQRIKSSSIINMTDWVNLFCTSTIDCIIHTAGPYIDCIPRVLQAAIDAQVPVYIDVSDPLYYLEYGINMHHTALLINRTTAILAAGAYPGMSNVLGIETAMELMNVTQQEQIQDVRYNFFAAGLGGIGLVNLYITNIGFGDPIALYENGQLRFFTALSGMLLGTVDFFFPENLKTKINGYFGNEDIKERIGTKQVFAWPFPEGATVPVQLRARGSSSVAMGVAPDLWNTILGLLVAIVPRAWWKNYRFSKFMADFSQPLVILTDRYMKLTDPKGIGETHAMRIDVTSIDGKRTMTTIQAHDSLRLCVGQSCAEFALDCLENPMPGVYYPEQRYQDDTSRTRIITKLTNTSGTFCFIGPIETTTDTISTQPTNIHNAIELAKGMELKH